MGILRARDPLRTTILLLFRLRIHTAQSALRHRAQRRRRGHQRYDGPNRHQNDSRILDGMAPHPSPGTRYHSYTDGLRVCQGWTLRSDNPFFARRAIDQDSDTAANGGCGHSFQSSGVADDEDDYEYSGSDTEEENEDFVDIDVEAGMERESVDGET